MLREAVLATAYARKYPDGPPFHTLSPRRKAEIRGYFESRGVIFNPHFGVTGRINGYAALRDFTVEEDRAEEIAKRAGEQEEEEAEAAAAEEEELSRAAGTSPQVTLRKDPERETNAKQELAGLQREWPPTGDKSPEAEEARNDLLDRAMVILEPYAKMAAKQHLGPHFSEEDAEEIAHDALVDWKVKVLDRVNDMRKGKANSKGQLYPDKFVGKKLGTGTARNLIADVGTFVYNKMQSQRKTTAQDRKSVV